LSLSFAPSIRVEEPTLSIVAIRLRLVSFSGASDSITFQRPLNSSISAMSLRISGVMVTFLISWVRISIYTHFYPVPNQWQALSILTRLHPFACESQADRPEESFASRVDSRNLQFAIELRNSISAPCC